MHISEPFNSIFIVHAGHDCISIIIWILINNFLTDYWTLGDVVYVDINIGGDWLGCCGNIGSIVK